MNTPQIDPSTMQPLSPYASRIIAERDALRNAIESILTDIHTAASFRPIDATGDGALHHAARTARAALATGGEAA